MGNAGAEILFNTCFDSDWMIQDYQQVAPHPVANVVVRIFLDYSYLDRAKTYPSVSIVVISWF